MPPANPGGAPRMEQGFCGVSRYAGPLKNTMDRARMTVYGYVPGSPRRFEGVTPGWESALRDKKGRIAPP